MMLASDRLDHQPTEVASKVLRRAQVSKMTRALQDRLALANVKIKHGWENLSLDSIEPQIDKELKRKRPHSSNDTVISDASSAFSDRRIFHNTSPLAPPIFSDVNGSLGRSRRTNGSISFSKGSARNDLVTAFSQRYPASGRQARRPVAATKSTASSWKKAHRLPQSSPTYRSKRSRYHLPNSQALSFVSETSTIPNDPISPYVSTTSCSDDNINHNNNDDEDDQDLPIASFNADITQIRSSPPATTITTNTSMTPRTPSPDHQFGVGTDGTISTRRLRSQAFKPQSRGSQHGRGNNGGGEGGAEGAGLLLYLASSPSPANTGNGKADNNNNINNEKTNSSTNDLPEARTPRSHHTSTTTTTNTADAAPSTPPPKQTPLPSSMMTTPGGTNTAAGGASTMLGFGATTPSVGFNFADFVNITPSPAQGAWSRTPVVGKGDAGGGASVSRTPLAAREARRRINFDALMPSGSASTSGMNVSMSIDDDGGDGGVDDGDDGSGEREKEPRGLGMELGGALVS